MLKTFFVDGDKGGVGKSTVARAIIDMLIQAKRFGFPAVDTIIVVDADPMNADVCGTGGYTNEVVGNTEIVAIRFPIAVFDDWKEAIDMLFDALNKYDYENKNVRVVFSLPAAAGLVLLENPDVFSLISILNGIPVWVLGNEESSVEQLKRRIEVAPLQYALGFAVRNLKHGPIKSFDCWNNSEVRKTVLDWGWQEIDFPICMASVINDIGGTPAHRVVALKTGLNGKPLGPGTRIVYEGYRSSANNRLSLMERIVTREADDE